jgi:uncharacterized protein YerC
LLILVMVRLNQHPLSGEQMGFLHMQLSKTISRLSERQARNFLGTLLGPEEQIMIAKRLAIVVLLLENRTLYSIASLLKVSPSTAEKIKRQLDEGALDAVVNVLKKDKLSYMEILSFVDNILHLNGLLPHYSGPKRTRR